MWEIKTTVRFDDWFSELCATDRACVLAMLLVLREKGPRLARPYADTVKGSRYSNMKELRVQSRGEPMRLFFAFDPHRSGILLCAGKKTGNEKRFYNQMIAIADKELTDFVNTLEAKE